jgi:hypothetical protein
MRHLIVYQTGTMWFAHIVETSDNCKEFRRVKVPQTVAEIEALAEREGFEIEWDSPVPPRQPSTR